MRIFFISPNPLWGGAATANISIAQMLATEHDVFYNDEYNKLNIEIVAYDSYPVHKYKDSNKLFNYLVNNQIDWVIWGNANVIPYYSSLINKLNAFNIRQCVLFHSLSLSKSVKGRFMEWLVSRSLKSIDHLIFVSKYTDISWSKYKTVRDHHNHHVIYNPINIVKTRINTDKHRVGYVGRFSEEKQPEVFARISEIDSKNRYIAWGGGKLLDDMVNKYPKVEFKGHSSNQDEIYGSFDILVMTSLFENCPMVILEAWKYGIPCVVPNVGGIPEIVKNNSIGILYDGYDVKDILSGIENIKQNYNFYSKNCSEIVKNFSYENIKSKWNNIINHK